MSLGEVGVEGGGRGQGETKELEGPNGILCLLAGAMAAENPGSGRHLDSGLRCKVLVEVLA